jgi:hypothetical protein
VCILCTVFRLIVVLFCMMCVIFVLCVLFLYDVCYFCMVCVICVLCLIVVPLPLGENPFAVKYKYNIIISTQNILYSLILLSSMQ